MGSALELLTLAEPLLCVVVILLLVKRGQLGQYKFLAALVAIRLLSEGLLISLLHTRWHLWTVLRLGVRQLYEVYFYAYWLSYALEALVGLAMIVSIYRLAMEPLEGLRSLGMVMFRWAAAISIAVAVTIGFGPHVTSVNFVIRVVSQLQQIQSVLTLCMLLFVTIAIHPMGLTYRSRVFGVSLGLGILATVDLVQAAWLPHISNMNSTYSAIGGITACVSLLIWSAYFALPEPKRRIIMLPTTSPFFRWNQISEALGDDPGYVAIGQVTSDMLAPAEIEVMRRASDKMQKAFNY